MSRKAVRYFAALLAALLCVTLISFTAFGESSSDAGSGSSDSATVTFDFAGGTGSSSSVTVKKGTAVSTLETPTRKGYQFVSWLANGQEISGSAPIDSDITLKAEWKDAAETVTVTFDFAGGTGSNSSVTVKKGTAVSTLETPTREGYTFISWLSGGSEIYGDTSIENDITLTAEWKEDTSGGHETVSPSKVMVTFDLAGGTGPTSQYLDKGTTISELKSATRDGYTFVAWMYNGTEVSDSFSIDTDITLTAEWKQNPVTSSSKPSGAVSVADSDPGVTASEDWNALLNPSSAASSSAVSSSVTAGISSIPSKTTTSGRKFSSLFYIGIVLIVLGLAGIGTFIYLFVLGKREGRGGPHGGASSGSDAEQTGEFTDITSYSDGKLHDDANSLASDSGDENPDWSGNLDGKEKK